MNKIQTLILCLLTLITASCANHQTTANSSSEQYAKLMRIGSKLSHAGQHVTAETFYEKAHQAAPQKMKPLHELALTAKHQGHFDQAIGYYQQILKINPHDHKARLALADCYIMKKQFELAALELQILKKENAFDASAKNSLAVLFDRAAAHWSAQVCYQRGLKKEVGNTKLLFNYALSLIISENYSEAKKILRQLRRHPEQQQIASHYLELLNQFTASTPVNTEALRSAIFHQVKFPERVLISQTEINRLRKMC